MTSPRAISPVVRKVRRDQLDEQVARRAHWATRSPEERFAEVESLRRLWIEITGDPDAPIMRVVHRRRLGEPPIPPPR
jgi:hypothetical protein